ncbi:MAG: hypothetical protein A2991_02885 [Candidatus Terrybacteria bacterium RIFCSPLOWO2_01_FULL_58_14]|uniref:Uncharacterized protein n=2 Tax=Candidatus Terryibacteriota TaxID=1817920 RepID=A0A1G2Q0S4_9BACT|nr:MAG: hypothetical protein A2682_02470 [Candidatus Terrybacteria bacterium RIFCSPHIGHO2_01_FULL_58_15]OHA54180.1 MAG: hypothetical protein A2991_02885 [Candidatus Terrybacteria bacterium RIFCSPLOWO2_01_FULL_58_14]
MDRLVAQLLTSDFSGAFAPEAWFTADLFSTVRRTLEVVSILLFLAIIYVFNRLMRVRPDVRPLEHMSESLRGSIVSTNRFVRQWQRIRQRLESPVETEWKIAVLEADSLINDLLRRMGYPGTSTGERLKGISKAQLTSLDALWEAHKVRNMVAHDPQLRLVYRQAREALEGFEVFLREIQILQ